MAGEGGNAPHVLTLLLITHPLGPLHSPHFGDHFPRPQEPLKAFERSNEDGLKDDLERKKTGGRETSWEARVESRDRCLHLLPLSPSHCLLSYLQSRFSPYN